MATTLNKIRERKALHQEAGNIRLKAVRRINELNVEGLLSSQRLLDKRTGAEARIAAMNQRYADSTGKVLNSQALKALERAAFLEVPTLTSIFFGFESARASAAERERLAVDADIAQENVRLKREVELNKVDADRRAQQAKQISDVADIQAGVVDKIATTTTLGEGGKGGEIKDRQKRFGITNQTRDVAAPAPQDSGGMTSEIQQRIQRRVNLVTPEMRQLVTRVVAESNSPLKNDPTYVDALISRGLQESSLNENIGRGAAGEKGPLQITPGAFEDIKSQLDFSFDELSNFENGFKAAIAFDNLTIAGLNKANIPVSISNLNQSYNGGRKGFLQGTTPEQAKQYDREVSETFKQLSGAQTIPPVGTNSVLAPDDVPTVPDDVPTVENTARIEDTPEPVTTPEEQATQFRATNNITDSNVQPSRGLTVEEERIATLEDAASLAAIESERLAEEARLAEEERVKLQSLEVSQEAARQAITDQQQARTDEILAGRDLNDFASGEPQEVFNFDGITEPTSIVLNNQPATVTRQDDGTFRVIDEEGEPIVFDLKEDEEELEVDVNGDQIIFVPLDSGAFRLGS